MPVLAINGQYSEYFGGITWIMSPCLPCIPKWDLLVMLVSGEQYSDLTFL